MNRSPDFAEVMRRNKQAWRRQCEGNEPPAQQIPQVDEAQPPPADLRVTLLGSSTLPATIDIAEGVQAQLGDIVAAAHVASGLSVEEWNALSDADRDAQLELEIGARRVEAAASAPGGQPGGSAQATSLPSSEDRFSPMTKAQLLKVAAEEFKTQLDGAKRKDDLLAEVRALAAKAVEAPKSDGSNA